MTLATKNLIETMARNGVRKPVLMLVHPFLNEEGQPDESIAGLDYFHQFDLIAKYFLYFTDSDTSSEKIQGIIDYSISLLKSMISDNKLGGGSANNLYVNFMSFPFVNKLATLDSKDLRKFLDIQYVYCLNEVESILDVKKDDDLFKLIEEAFSEQDNNANKKLIAVHHLFRVTRDPKGFSDSWFQRLGKLINKHPDLKKAIVSEAIHILNYIKDPNDREKFKKELTYRKSGWGFSKKLSDYHYSSFASLILYASDEALSGKVVHAPQEILSLRDYKVSQDKLSEVTENQADYRLMTKQLRELLNKKTKDFQLVSPQLTRLLSSDEKPTYDDIKFCIESLIVDLKYESILSKLILHYVNESIIGEDEEKYELRDNFTYKSMLKILTKEKRAHNIIELFLQVNESTNLDMTGSEKRTVLFSDLEKTHFDLISPEDNSPSLFAFLINNMEIAHADIPDNIEAREITLTIKTSDKKNYLVFNILFNHCLNLIGLPLSVLCMGDGERFAFALKQHRERHKKTPFLQMSNIFKDSDFSNNYFLQLVPFALRARFLADFIFTCKKYQTFVDALSPEIEAASLLLRTYFSDDTKNIAAGLLAAIEFPKTSRLFQSSAIHALDFLGKNAISHFFYERFNDNLMLKLQSNSVITDLIDGLKADRSYATLDSPMLLGYILLVTQYDSESVLGRDFIKPWVEKYGELIKPLIVRAVEAIINNEDISVEARQSFQQKFLKRTAINGGKTNTDFQYSSVGALILHINAGFFTVGLTDSVKQIHKMKIPPQQKQQSDEQKSENRDQKSTELKLSAVLKQTLFAKPSDNISGRTQIDVNNNNNIDAQENNIVFSNNNLYSL